MGGWVGRWVGGWPQLVSPRRIRAVSSLPSEAFFLLLHLSGREAHILPTSLAAGNTMWHWMGEGWVGGGNGRGQNGLHGDKLNDTIVFARSHPVQLHEKLYLQKTA